MMAAATLRKVSRWFSWILRLPSTISRSLTRVRQSIHQYFDSLEKVRFLLFHRLDFLMISEMGTHHLYFLHILDNGFFKSTVIF